MGLLLVVPVDVFPVGVWLFEETDAEGLETDEVLGAAEEVAVESAFTAVPLILLMRHSICWAESLEDTPI